ncbi:MAG: hypothetical protein HRF43_04600 [Phycisphaerae bacterium]|jgi:hypothetical protein
MVTTSARERIESALRAQICPVCVEVLPDGSCGLPPQYPCALFRHLDRVIEVVATTRSDSMDLYVDRLREVVCAHCRLDEVSGDCRRPDDRVCPLDSYLPLVVEIIESERARG